jgi:hypothetical protein
VFVDCFNKEQSLSKKNKEQSLEVLLVTLLKKSSIGEGVAHRRLVG